LVKPPYFLIIQPENSILYQFGQVIALRAREHRNTATVGYDPYYKV